MSTEADPAANDRLADAARNSAFARVAAADSTGSALLAAMGGWLGVAEALVPGIAFLVLYVCTKNLWLAVGVPAALGVLALLVRILRQQPVASALGGLAGLVLSGVLALRSGDGADYFLIGFWTNAAYAVGLALSMLIRWPVVGLLAGFLHGDGTSWRADRRLARLMQAATGAWVLLFLARLAVQLPLYFAGAVEALGIARLLMGAPLFAVLVVLTVLFVRAVYTTKADNERSE